MHLYRNLNAPRLADDTFGYVAVWKRRLELCLRPIFLPHTYPKTNRYLTILSWGFIVWCTGLAPVSDPQTDKYRHPKILDALMLHYEGPTYVSVIAQGRFNPL